MPTPNNQQQTSTKTSSIASHLLVTTVPLPEITSRPQKGIIQDETPPAFTVALPAIDDSISSSTFPSIISTTPSSVPFASSTPDIPQDYDREKHDDDDDFADMFKSGPPPPGPPGLSQASEHALIAVGSIGRAQTAFHDVELHGIANMIFRCFYPVLFHRMDSVSDNEEI